MMRIDVQKFRNRSNYQRYENFCVM